MGKSRPTSITGSVRHYSAGSGGQRNSAHVILIIMLMMVRERAVRRMEPWPITNQFNIRVCLSCCMWRQLYPSYIGFSCLVLEWGPHSQGQTEREREIRF